MMRLLKLYFKFMAFRKSYAENSKLIVHYKTLINVLVKLNL